MKHDWLTEFYTTAPVKFQIGIVLLFWLLCQIVVHLENSTAVDFQVFNFNTFLLVTIASSAFISSGRCPSQVRSPGRAAGGGELVGSAEGHCGPAGTCLTLYLGVFIEGERTVIVQNSVSQWFFTCKFRGVETKQTQTWTVLWEPNGLHGTR